MGWAAEEAAEKTDSRNTLKARGRNEEGKIIGDTYYRPLCWL